MVGRQDSGSANNPTGAFLHGDDLTALAEISADRGWPIIGDEVFADYPRDPAPHAVPVIAAAHAMTVTLGGLSKSVGLPQLKLGWIGFGGPGHLVDEALAAYEMVADTYLSVSTPVQAAAAELLASGAAIRAQILARVTRNLASLRAIAAHYPAAIVLPAEGGWSAVIRVPSMQSEESLAMSLLSADNVLVHPGYFFDFIREAFVIVSLLVAPDRFDIGATRVLARASGLA